MQYAKGTELRQRMPWGLFVGGKAMCSDGVVRRLHTIVATADTFFSIPASVQVSTPTGRKTVQGYVMIETMEGNSTATESDPAVVKFRQVKRGKNYNCLPEWVK